MARRNNRGNTDQELNVVIDWSDVKQKFLGLVQDGKPYKGTNSNHTTARRMAQLHNDPYEDKLGKWDGAGWEGGNGSDTLGWLRDGFHAKEFAHSAEYVETAITKRATWNDEEGDVDPGRLIGGYDEFFLGMADRPSKPGLRLQIEFAFACGCPAKTIQEYGAWVAGLIGSLETSGYDLTVDLWIYLDGLFGDSGETLPYRSNVLVRVKRPNEVSNFTEWSSLFAPSGYRHLGFLSKLVAGDKIKQHASETLGTTIGGRGWGVEYEPETSTVKIRANQRAYEGELFPADKLNKEAADAGLIPQQGEGQKQKA